MFLTRMALDVNRPDTKQALSNLYLLQSAVNHAFGGQQVHCLWQVEMLNHRMHLILLSPLRPTLWPAHQQYGYPGAFPSWETWSLDEELDGLHQGEKLHFRLCTSTCPPMTVAESTHRMAMETTAWQQAWLEQRRAAWGFTYEPRNLTISRSEWITWRSPASDTTMTCHQVTFHGELTITDSELFAAALTAGMGEFNQMGAGLMTFEPVEKYRYV